MTAVAIAALLGAVAALASRDAGGMKVVATNLNNPRKLFVGADGAVYVVEAGRGGRDRCLGHTARKVCIGLTGAITRIAGGGKQRVVTGLWSGARTDGSQGQGPADVLVRGRTYYVLLQNGGITPQGFNSLGPDGATAGDLISTPAGKANPAVIVNLAAFEAARVSSSVAPRSTATRTPSSRIAAASRSPTPGGTTCSGSARRAACRCSQSFRYAARS